MRNFWLKRIEDESGISGVGVVAEGTQFVNGKCVLAWVTQFQSIAVYDSIEELESIHGHNGKTVIVWAQPTQRAADLSEREALPLNMFIPAVGGAFFVHWSCSRCQPDVYDTSDSCHQCGKPRTVESESR